MPVLQTKVPASPRLACSAGLRRVDSGVTAAGGKVLLGIDNDPTAFKMSAANFRKTPIHQGDVSRLTVNEICRLAGVRDRVNWILPIFRRPAKDFRRSADGSSPNRVTSSSWKSSVSSADFGPEPSSWKTCAASFRVTCVLSSWTASKP